jgi:mannitol-1-phosphate/altronate dehydrogenase
LLTRMTNPFLRDRVDRVTRDIPRKLAWEDRLVGTMRLALDAGVAPRRFALGVAAALQTLEAGKNPRACLETLWPVPDQPPGRKARLLELILEAETKLNPKVA